MITKKEFKFIIYATLFAFILFGLIIPNILGWIDGISPVLQFLIFNVSLFIFIQIFLSSLYFKILTIFHLNVNLVLRFFIKFYENNDFRFI